jgi:hypothetical protein
MQLPERILRNVGVYLCRYYVGMSEHHLHRAQISPAFQ